MSRRICTENEHEFKITRNWLNNNKTQICIKCALLRGLYNRDEKEYNYLEMELNKNEK